jgi:hypothetical protein
MNERTITNLSKMNGRVYVYLANVELGERFLQESEDEGFVFTDGAKPTAKCWAEIIAVNHEKTLNYVGTNGRIAFGSAVKQISGEEFIRVDFEKYSSGEVDYFYKKQ